MGVESYTWEDLLVILQKANPIKAEALWVHRRRSEHGLLSVGLKIHCLTDGYPELKPLVDAVGGFMQRPYTKQDAALTYLLPPVGSASTAVMLLECIEEYTKQKLFNNPQVQIQVCSPCRLEPEYASILGLVFYLGSDVLRRYSIEDFGTTFSKGWLNGDLVRGRRLVLYDGQGDLDRNFEWWDIDDQALVVEEMLPFKSERTDVLTATSRVDIHNINLVMTLLSHHQEVAYWEHLGLKFKQEVEALMKEHQLPGVLLAPWVHVPDTAEAEADDTPFLFALDEVMQYAFAESQRIKKARATFWRAQQQEPPGILSQMHSLLQKYRRLLDEEGRSITRSEEA